MTEWTTDAEFLEAFIARTAELRAGRGWTAEQMAIALGIPADRYRKYEYRTPMPHSLIERFATVVDRDVQYVLTGKSTGRKRAPPPPKRRTGTDG